MTPSAAGINLSKRQISDADRVGGIELMILWPEALGDQPADLGEDYEREASPGEKAAAEALIGPACRAADLVPVHVRVARIRRPSGLPLGDETHAHLAVTLIGRRWVHASSHKRPRAAFAMPARRPSGGQRTNRERQAKKHAKADAAGRKRTELLLDEHLRAWLDDQAAQLELTRSEYVEELLRERQRETDR